MPRPIQTDFFFTTNLAIANIPDLPKLNKPRKRSFKTNNSMDLDEMKNDALYVFSRLVGRVEHELKRLTKKECPVSEYEALIHEIQRELSFIECQLMQ